jgi:hypothetical protein
MTEIEVLRKDLGVILIIYTVAKETFTYCYYLHKPDTELEREYLTKDRHLHFIRHILWRQSIVELSKLTSFSNNDEFRITNYIGRLWRTKEIKDKLNPSLFIRWKEELRQNSIAIKHINDLRNKIYAHTDRETEEYRKLDIYFDDVVKVFDAIGSIIKEIYNEVFDSGVDLTTPTFERNHFDLVKVLAEAHNERIRKLMEPFSKGA